MKKSLDEKLKYRLNNNNSVINSAQRIILKIMKLRNNYGFTQNQLASKSGISHTSIARIENFVMQPTLKMVLQILDVYDLTLDVVPKDNRIEHCVNFQDYYTNNSKVINREKKENIKIYEVITFIKDNIKLQACYDEDYSKFINNIFLVYTDFLKEKNVDKKTKDIIERFGKYIQLILSEYYRGQHNTAYFLFKEALESCINIELFFKDISDNTIFYRYRHRKKYKLKKQDFFHIPFSKRYSVSTQRYSVPGMPCLYLGSSKNVCEIESKTNDIVIASVKYKSNNKKYKIFDLTSIFFEDIEELCTSEWLKCIPLYLICSTYIDYQDKNVRFKQEYIFSQLLLEYIINESTLSRDFVIGLKYFSVHTDIWDAILNKKYDYLCSVCNYVFPSRDIKDDDYCELLNDNFEIIEIS